MLAAIRRVQMIEREARKTAQKRSDGDFGFNSGKLSAKAIMNAAAE